MWTLYNLLTFTNPSNSMHKIVTSGLKLHVKQIGSCLRKKSVIHGTVKNI